MFGGGYTAPYLFIRVVVTVDVAMTVHGFETYSVLVRKTWS